MQIKRFEAKSMTLALRQIKEEFGPDAVILSARSVRSGRGLFGSTQETAVEVTAAQDTAAPAAFAPVRAAVASAPASLPAPAGNRHGLLRALNQGLRQLAFRHRAAESPLPDRSEAAGLGAWRERLLAQELDAGLTAELLGYLQRCGGGDLGAEFKRRLTALRPQAAPADAARILALVGPAGVGKTTTAIKIAAARLSRGEPTALLTLDDRRIGAHAQLRIYAEILGIPLASASSAAAVGGALAQLGDRGTVIVDTPGISPGEEAQRAELKEMLAALPAAEVLVTLSASACARALKRAVDAWADTALSGIVFTRLDESDVWGPALSAALQAGLPVAYAACGPRIPEDLAADPLEMILERLMPSPRVDDRRPETGRLPAGAGAIPAAELLVANRSSDLYHRSGCRWVRKIKPENLLRFAAPHEAEARHFMPCRNCNPELAGPAADPSAGEGMRLAGRR
ncbi:MAG: hypothetical protein MUD16_11180 [Desulfobacterales bacterium]|jgi:flagellar biosynthesis protein FlhF|nr:hypothetical protein [Desulfobacterales bacterium]